MVSEQEKQTNNKRSIQIIVFIMALAIMLVGTFYLGGFTACHTAGGVAYIAPFGMKCIQPKVIEVCETPSGDFLQMNKTDPFNPTFKP
jgi:hypothetical protein